MEKYVKTKSRISLPICKNLRTVTSISVMIALLCSVSSVLGLVYPSVFYPDDKLLTSFIPTDSINLVLGFSLLILSIVYTRQSRLTGLLFWPGMLFYMLYIYVPYLLIIPFNFLFPVYLLIVTLSGWAIIALLTSIEPEAIKKRLTGHVYEKLTAGILITLGLLVLLRQSALIIMALINKVPYDMHEVALWIDDFAFAVPALLIGGILLWKRKALGYLIAPGLLLAYGLLSLGLIPYYLYHANITQTAADISSLFVVSLMAVICFVPLSFFLKRSRYASNKD